jgi:peroxiredoxin
MTLTNWCPHAPALEISTMKLFLLTITMCCFLFLVTACGPPPPKAVIGQPAPDFTLTDTKGKTWNLADLKGKVVFVNFWATWCAPCREEMPAMQRLLDMMPEDKFTMLAILNRDTPANADLFVQKNNITIPILNDMGNNIGPMYGLTGLPETFIIDKQGILREKFIGPAKWDSPEAVQMIMQYINDSTF